MKKGYQCDRKLKIYDHISFYEANLLRAKKLYIPNGDKTPNGRKKLYESKSKTNVNGLIKKYYADIQKMKKFEQLQPKRNNDNNFDEEVFTIKKERLKNIILNYVDDNDEDKFCESIINGMHTTENNIQNLKGDRNEADYAMRVTHEVLSEDDLEEYYVDVDNKNIESITDVNKKEDEHKEEISMSKSKMNISDIKEYPLLTDVIVFEKNDAEVMNLMNKLSISVADKYKDFVPKSREEANEEEEENNDKMRDIFQNQTDKDAFIDYQSHALDTLKESNENKENDDEVKKEISVKKIQNKFRRHKQKTKGKEKIYVGWNETETNLISVYINKCDGDNVISIYVKIYSKENLINYIEVMTIPEMKKENIVQYDRATKEKIKEDAKSIAMQLLKTFERKRIEERLGKKEEEKEDDDEYKFDEDFPIHEVEEDDE